MAKGQKRSNREIKKPKKDKPQPKTEDTFSKQIKLTTDANTARGKGKS